MNKLYRCGRNIFHGITVWSLLFLLPGINGHAQSIAITAPASGATIAPNANYTFQVSTTGSVTSVVYWVDNWSWIGQSNTAPFSLNWTNNLSNGNHIVKARANFSNGSTLDATDVAFVVGTGGGGGTPVTTTLNPTDDRDVQSDVAAGTNPVINTSQWNTSFFRFDLNPVPGSVSSARLRLYKGNSASSGMTMTIQYTTTDNWTQSGSNPGVGSVILTTAVPDAAGYVEFDVTGAVQSRITGTKLISFAVNTSSGGWTNLNTKESSSNKPQLVIISNGGGGTVPVTGVFLSPTSLSLGVGNSASLTATVSPSNATNKTVSWSTSNAGIASVNSSGLVTGVAAGSATITATTADGGKTATCAVTVTASSGGGGNMRIGVNFWNISWEGWADYFQSGVNWSTTTNPWNPALLSDLAPFSGPIRYMDFDNINNSTIVNWSDRVQKTANHYNTTSVAYEWMIDLCNRTGKDMWVCVPTYTNQNYWTQLATLIKNNLNSNLKVYVEYSNETWNGGFQQFQYCISQGQSLGLPGSNQYYQGGAFSVYRSLQIFQAFQNVFGAAAMGSRVIRVCSFSGNMDIADQAFANVLPSATWNPDQQQVDLAAIAPYIGPNDDAAGGGVLDGAESNIAARFRANVDWNYTHYIQPAISIANKYGFKLGCYEGGQQLTTNAGAWSSNPDIYTEYTYMLNKWKPANFVLFNHYTLYGAYSSGGAWGAKADATQTTANSPKYHALIDWMSANPATQASGRDSVRAQATAETDPVSAANRFSFSVFPNPAFRSLTISLLGLKEQNLVIRLVSLKGSVLREQTVKAFTGNNSYRFSLGSVSSGLYFIDVLADGRSYVKEVMVR